MYSVKVEGHFSAAHNLREYKGKCEELHGHNFRVEALFQGEEIGPEGMLIDFAILKRHLRQILADLDHKYINEIPFFRERASSSEYLALYVHDRLRKLVAQDGVTVREVRVWESDNAYAAYGGSSD